MRDEILLCLHCYYLVPLIGHVVSGIYIFSLQIQKSRPINFLFNSIPLRSNGFSSSSTVLTFDPKQVVGFYKHRFQNRALKKSELLGCCIFYLDFIAFPSYHFELVVEGRRVLHQINSKTRLIFLVMDPEASECFQAQAHIYRHIFNFISSMSLKCALQLGIPDIIHIHGGPITLSELVVALNVDPTKASCIYRLMRMLVHSGFFATTKIDEQKEAYVLTPSSKILVKDKINCLSPFVMSMLHPALMNPWQFLGDWIQGNSQRPFESANGKPFWEYMDENSEFKNLFHDGMESDSQMMNLVIKDCKPIFEGLNSLVDVGGGTGTIARVISEAYPQLKCTVFDFPHVVANLPDNGNLTFVGGDLLQYIPPADAILMKLVLHAFDDQNCIKILKRCREAIPTQGTKGRVIIIDIVMDEKKDEHEITKGKLYFDMLMMVVVTGRERTKQDWEKLFLAAGFNGYKILPLFGLRSLIEVYP